MKYEQIDKSLFEHNRKKFTSMMRPNSLAVFNSNDIFSTSADSTLPFKQHSDIFWLSGIDQEESILVLFPSCHNEKHREILFLKETNEHIAIWEGEKLSADAAYEVSGIRTVYWLDQFETIFKQLMSEAETVYINTNEHWRASVEMQTREDRWIEWCRNKYPGHNYARSNPILHQLRAVKHPIEIELMKRACSITEKGFRRLLKFIKPGVKEYEIEAELWHEFIRNRSRGFAYTPIIASGRNSCVLHYIENNQECKDGEVILMDFGAEYANYSSDLTRCVPVNGRFTKRQKDVYNAVLRVKNGAIELLRPGKTLSEYHKQVGELMEKELVDLGLITMDDIRNQSPDKPAYKKYFMHGTSHYIGLDTHDYGPWHEPIPENSVFTVEPGIYILEENLGIRLEDDYLVTSDGHINLMESIPIEADEIEELMNA
ncbi:MAG: aminopeptidase P family protein [Salibacteraceae bacterium]